MVKSTQRVDGSIGRCLRRGFSLDESERLATVKLTIWRWLQRRQRTGYRMRKSLIEVVSPQGRSGGRPDRSSTGTEWRRREAGLCRGKES